MPTKVIAIIGPTASGKSDLGVELALKFSGEVISADSRQVYQGLDIGSGKITKAEMRGIPHHLLDVADPRTQTFTVADYQKLSREKIEDINSRGKIPFLVGGTGFYIDATLYNLQLPEVPPNETLRAELATKSIEELFAKLQTLDPERAETVDPHNPVRLIRALEIAMSLGKVPSLAERKPLYDYCKIGLEINPETLREKIKARLAKRLKEGMIQEVATLHDQGLSWEKLEAFGLEYRYIAEFLQNKLTEDALEQEIVSGSVQYAKRQMTWFRRDPNVQWITDPLSAFPIVQTFLKQ